LNQDAVSKVEDDTASRFGQSLEGNKKHKEYEQQEKCKYNPKETLKKLF